MKNFIPLLLISVSFLMSACGSGEANKIVDEFHKKLDAKEYDYICDNMLSEDALEATSREEWMGMFTTLDSWGKLKKRKKQSGFSSKTNNGITTVKLKYTFAIDTTLFYERIVTIDDGTGPKLLAFSVNTDEAVVDEFVAGY